MSGQLNELRLQVERLDYDNKESMITIDILKEQNQDAKSEIDEFKKMIADLKAAQKDASAEDKEKRKQEKMALMMAKFDAVMNLTISRDSVHLTLQFIYSKAHSLRKRNSSDKFCLNWIRSRVMMVFHRSPTTISSR